MTSTQTIVLAFLALAVVAIALAVGFGVRRAALRRRFGPEYDRVVEERESRIAADRELAGRRRRHHELRLRTIDPAARDRFIQRWRAVQTQFIDDPAGALGAGDQLVTELVRERGYPTRDYDEELSLLSVEHARTLSSYRDAHEIFLKARRGEATTEDLRQALVHYRDLFADILGVPIETNDTESREAAGDRPTARSETTSRPAAGTETGHRPATGPETGHRPATGSEPTSRPAAGSETRPAGNMDNVRPRR